ncbi:uncharacterized protein LOC129767974 [Toxorhynchites rutilus septentrionalis]|uniref:uncharacterized protein LOC129767974 n=1 Tax=Toxorhynchites rutilus septentrionalis TaxID=329112 RepID=UPI002478DDF1|nr:uncharacterized protein LOC129767974 [Toxorhynchites rutilus septentrionalis]
MLKLVLCLSFLGLVASYDFQDSFYNEALLEDLLDGDTLTPMDRFKRSAADATEEKNRCEGRRHHKHKCCNDDNTENLEKMRDLKKQCFAEIRAARENAARGASESVDMFSCERVNRTKGDLVCAMECVGRKKNVVDAEGNLLEPSILVPFVKENYAADAWQEPLVAGFVDTCLKEVAEKSAKPSGKEYRCNPSASHFQYCMWRQSTLACPKEKQDTSRKCIRARERFATNVNNEKELEFHNQDLDDNDAN